jgi:hypothetical protein
MQTEVLGRKPGDFTRSMSDHEVIKTMIFLLEKIAFDVNIIMLINLVIFCQYKSKFMMRIIIF